MPKELIHDAHSNPEAKTASVELTWTREPTGWVQLGSVMLDLPLDDVTRGMYVTLDRAGINRLIRTLRRARDAAFGADA